MKIKTLIEFLNKGVEESRSSTEMNRRTAGFNSSDNENVVYIENSRLETAIGQASPGKELLGGGTGWADRSLGDILVSQGKLSSETINRIVDYQRDKGLYFGEAALELGLVTHDDILKALSTQFGYSYAGDDASTSSDMVMAREPFGDIAEEFRSIRARLLNEWLSPAQKTLAIVSPGNNEGRSYFAANIALAFSQLGKSTLLIDADLRSPRQHEMFALASRVGLSMLLAGRVRIDELEMLPEKLSTFPCFSVLGSGPIPPNPSELLSSDRFLSILRKLEKYFDVIIIDSPSAACRADILSIVSVAGSALIVARRGYSKMTDTKALLAALSKTKAKIVGSVLNQF